MEDAKELRQMPEIQNIAEYLRGMSFRKKAFGGCDVESVYEHFSTVTQMYEAIICGCMEQADINARQLAEFEVRHTQEEAAAAPQQEPPQWYAAPIMQPRPMQQPQPMLMQQPMQHSYMAQNPWLPTYSPSPWAQRPASPQAYYAPQQAYAWPNEPDGLPDPAYLYAQG